MNEKVEYNAISVVIATYNAAPYLQICLNSIYAQENKNLHIVIIDGGSTDHTIDILKKNSSKIKFWISEKDEGIYDALNKGLAHVSTPWVYFLGADDYLLPGFSDFSKCLEEENTIYYANVCYKGKKESGPLSSYRMAKHGIFHQTIVYPIHVFHKYTYDTQYPIAADYDLNMKCYGDLEFNFKYCDHVIAFYNDNGLSSYQVDTQFLADKERKIYANFGLGVRVRYWFRKVKSRLKRKEAL